MDYIAYLHKKKDSDFGVSFPDFPGCITAGRTLEEARHKAVEALALHIQGMVEDGITVPEASQLDDLDNDPDLRHGVAVLVTAELPSRRKPDCGDRSLGGESWSNPIRVYRAACS
jgi:predicted RNase H-like HicB family nuclease